MDLSLVIYSALGAAAGTLIGRLLNKLHKTESKKARPYNVIFTIAGITILPLLYRNMYLPRIIPMGPSEFGDSAVFYQSLQKHDPAAYEKVSGPLDRLTRKGDTSAEALQEIRSVLNEVLADKKRHANIKELRRETELSIWQFKILKDKAPEVCVQRANGRPFQNLAILLPEDYQKQETDLLVAYIESPNRPENINVDSERGAKLFTEFLTKSMTKLDSVNLDPPENDIPAQLKVCWLLVNLNEEILNTSDQNIYDIFGHLNK